MPERGEPCLATGGDQETRELPFIEEKQLAQRVRPPVHSGLERPAAGSRGVICATPGVC